MPIFYPNEHFTCKCYSSGDSPLIETRIVLPQQKGIDLSNTNCLIFLLEGNVNVEINGKQRDLVRRDFIFVAKRMSLIFSMDNACKILIVRIKDQIQLCQSFNIIELVETAKKEKKPIENIEFSVLKMCDPLWYYAKNLVSLLDDGLKCINFLRNKVEEVLILLRAYYTKEELYDIFYYILNPDAVFVEFVRQNWQNYRTVSELASAMNLSSQSFIKHFKEIYGRPPGEWILEEKSKLIFMEIKAGIKTFQQISDDFDFTAQSNFSRFCKKMFGASPYEIRTNGFSELRQSGCSEKMRKKQENT